MDWLAQVENSEGGPRGAGAAQIRVALPYHLRTLARLEGDVTLDVPAPVTLRAVLDALETRYPMLRGTIREYETGKRREFLRFFACSEDISLASPDIELPEAIAQGKEPLLIIGAIAGG
jgi:sulfur-carrier protein